MTTISLKLPDDLLETSGAIAQRLHLSRAEYIRRAECLCLNCGNLKPGQPDNCQIAQALFEVCVRENVALAVTRCPIWKTKETSPEASSSSCCGKGPYKD